jgi:hypothetical protein
MPNADDALVAEIREQIKILRNREYAYDELHVYLSGIAEPWVFGRADEFEFRGTDVLVVRVGPTREHDNADVPEMVFPLRHVVATELAASGG